MKKILVMLLMICVMSSMVACGNKNAGDNNSAPVENNGGTGVTDGVGNDADAIPNNDVNNTIDTVPSDTVNDNVNNANNTDNNGVVNNNNDGPIENMGEDIKEGAENVKDKMDSGVDNAIQNNQQTNNN